MMRICNFGGPFLCALANAYTCVRITSGRSLAVYAMVGATTVQAAIEKEAKGLCHWVKLVDECLMKNSGKFKLAVGMRDEC